MYPHNLLPFEWPSIYLYGIMIAVDGEDNGFTPDIWYEFEE